jgi:uncharacterized protein with PIN domain
MENTQSNIEMRCPICGERVTKVNESDISHKNSVKCVNEYYEHRGEQLTKFRNPKHNYYKA